SPALVSVTPSGSGGPVVLAAAVDLAATDTTPARSGTLMVVFGTDFSPVSAWVFGGDFGQTPIGVNFTGTTGSGVDSGSGGSGGSAGSDSSSSVGATTASGGVTSPADVTALAAAMSTLMTSAANPHPISSTTPGGAVSASTDAGGTVGAVSAPGGGPLPPR